MSASTTAGTAPPEVSAADAGCPDDQPCSFACKSACFRVLTLGPEPGMFPGDTWPEQMRKQHLALAETNRDAVIARRESESLGLLNEMVGRYRRAKESLMLTDAGSKLHDSAAETLAEVSDRRFIVKVACALHCGRKIDHEVTVAQYASNPTHPRMICGKH